MKSSLSSKEQEYIKKILESSSIEDTLVLNNTKFTSLAFLLSRKIDRNKYNNILNSIFHLSELLYAKSLLLYNREILKANEDMSKGTNITGKMLLIFHFFESADEICHTISRERLSISTISMQIRQILEHAVVSRRIILEKVDDYKIVQSAIVSFNKHIGANHLDVLEGMTQNNQGLLKCLSSRLKLTDIINECNLGWFYNFLSGNIHSLSTFEQLLPNSRSSDYEYIFLQTIYSALVYILEIFYKYFTDTDLNTFDLKNDFYLSIEY